MTSSNLLFSPSSLHTNRAHYYLGNKVHTGRTDRVSHQEKGSKEKRDDGEAKVEKKDATGAKEVPMSLKGITEGVLGVLPLNLRRVSQSRRWR